MKLHAELKLVGFFYLMTGIYWVAIGFMASYWTLYLTSLGLTFSQISLLLAIYPISALIFEIPTGAISDVYGRKISVFLSYLVTGVAFAGILLSKSDFILLVIFYSLAGISFTLESGALEAWFIDTVEEAGQSNYLHRLLGRWGSLSSVGFIIGPFLGGILVTQGVDKAFWATTCSMLSLSLFVLLFGREAHSRVEEPRVVKGFGGALHVGKDGLRYVLTHPVLLIMSLAMAALSMGNAISYNAYQPYMTLQAGLPPYLLGFALSISGMITVFSLNLSDKLKRKLGGNRNLLVISTLFFGIIIVAIGFLRFKPLLFMLLISMASVWEFAGYTSPAYRELFNKFVPSEKRATILSVNSFNMKIGELFGLIALGILGDSLGLQSTIITAGIVIVMLSTLYLRVNSIEGW